MNDWAYTARGKFLAIMVRLSLGFRHLDNYPLDTQITKSTSAEIPKPVQKQYSTLHFLNLKAQGDTKCLMYVNGEK